MVTKFMPFACGRSRLLPGRTGVLLLFLVGVVRLSAQSAFERYFASAQEYAANFPREKVYLHFDNTSYYQGDTIWYKAYVVDAVTGKGSRISRPLYVELVDQLGNVAERQTIKLTDGEGHGQISLARTFFTGYYEVRAYTKWMLAFGDDPQYFSRTFPIYRKRVPGQQKRSIATYRMDKSMKQRPQEKLKEMEVRFFPEGGRLVKGIPSVVGFETASRDSGWVDVEGVLLNAQGEGVAPVATYHEGMGSFMYTPGDKPGSVEIEYKGKKTRVRLPEAIDEGFVMTATTKETQIDVTVRRSSRNLSEPTALFVFSQGLPCTFIPVEFGSSLSRRIIIQTDSLPEGVLRLALVNERGVILSDRLTFVYPRQMLHFDARADARIYQPYAKGNCRIRLTGADGQPVEGAHVSVAVRDALDMDYRPFDNNICTDLLLTSGLKGYIHEPGFYFAPGRDETGALPSAGKRKMLDNLLLIRGWRQYDLEEAFGLKKAAPKYSPEPDLTLYGHVESWFGKSQAGLELSVLAFGDSTSISGHTLTDSLGNFQIPMEEFSGKLDAVIQTKRTGKKYNRNTLVSIHRNFEPPLRSYDYRELHPQWTIPADTTRLESAIDSLDTYLGDDDTHALGEIEVKAKRKKRNAMEDTDQFERDILGYYNVRQYVDRQRDQGKFVVEDVGYLMHQLNNSIDRDGLYYGASEMRYSANGHSIQLPFLKNCIDMIETAILYTDKNSLYSYTFNQDDFRVDKDRLTDIYTNIREADSINQASESKLVVRCAFTMNNKWQSGKGYAPAHGIRRTEISGYNAPVQFYVPPYDGQFPDNGDLPRRTLLWNPQVTTDSNGEIELDFRNSSNATFMDISAETIVDGKPAAVEHLTFR